MGGGGCEGVVQTVADRVVPCEVKRSYTASHRNHKSHSIFIYSIVTHIIKLFL